MARPLFSPTLDQRRSAKIMAGLGIPQEQIAQILEIAPRTLRKHFRAELNRGKAEANAKVLQTLYSMATNAQNTAATIFWIKTQCGWLHAPDKQGGAGNPPLPPKSALPGWLLKQLREQQGQRARSGGTDQRAASETGEPEGRSPTEGEDDPSGKGTEGGPQ